MKYASQEIGRTQEYRSRHKPRRILQRLLDADEEGHRFLAVDETVIVGQSEAHHRPDLDLAADHHRPFLDLVHAKNAGLRRVEDRRRHQRAVDAAVRDGEGAALQFLDLELAVAGAGGRRRRCPSRSARSTCDRSRGSPARRDLVGADRDAEVIVVLVDDVGAVDLGIDGRDFLERLDAGAHEEAHEAEFCAVFLLEQILVGRAQRS